MSTKYLLSALNWLRQFLRNFDSFWNLFVSNAFWPKIFSRILKTSTFRLSQASSSFVSKLSNIYCHIRSLTLPSCSAFRVWWKLSFTIGHSFFYVVYNCLDQIDQFLHLFEFEDSDVHFTFIVTCFPFSSIKIDRLRPSYILLHLFISFINSIALQSLKFFEAMGTSFIIFIVYLHREWCRCNLKF